MAVETLPNFAVLMYGSFLVNSGRTLSEVQQTLGYSGLWANKQNSHFCSKTIRLAANFASVVIRRGTPMRSNVNKSIAEASTQATVDAQTVD